MEVSAAEACPESSHERCRVQGVAIHSVDGFEAGARNTCHANPRESESMRAATWWRLRRGANQAIGGQRPQLAAASAAERSSLDSASDRNGVSSMPRPL